MWRRILEVDGQVWRVLGAQWRLTALLFCRSFIFRLMFIFKITIGPVAVVLGVMI
jgi:hypothetical protein